MILLLNGCHTIFDSIIQHQANPTRIKIITARVQQLRNLETLTIYDLRKKSSETNGQPGTARGTTDRGGNYGAGEVG